ncbi:MAG: DUF4180 domain-containing protein [Coprobacillaceae bacterium]
MNTIKIEKIQIDSKEIISVFSEDIVISDVQSALDFLISVAYEKECNNFIINKEAIVESFFDLSTCMAGDILQKCSNYQIKVAIYGDYKKYTSKALKDFIYESNKGNIVFFVSDIQEGIDLLMK